MAMQVGILIISDRGSRGDYEDRSGPVIAEIISQQTAWQISHRAIIPDDFETIVQTLTAWCEAGANLILTSGGTGFAPRDITPEATRRVIEREAPGLAEAVRADSLKITRHAMLSRAVAGIRGHTLIINMPGNPKAVRENLDFLLPVLPHALELLTEAPHSESQHRSV
ncbi:MAG: MogA/MoaB family molybdenum cofactor biosynthesis protein [Ardenticatenaceae bacterium]|nr:MogA/MoaB family molybdenum cofactor biosynthesis protein [Ardenticatenaceae bacterium]